MGSFYQPELSPCISSDTYPYFIVMHYGERNKMMAVKEAVREAENNTKELLTGSILNSAFVETANQLFDLR